MTLIHKKLTQKQRWILKAVVEGNVDDAGATESWLDLDQLLEKVPYEVSKEAMQFSLRFLMKRDFLINGEPENRRGRVRRILVPTEKAINEIRPARPFVVTEFEDFVELS